jgi:hypothetical protein
MSRTVEEQRAEGERINGIVTKYWDELAGRGGPPPLSTWKRQRRSALLATTFPKETKIADTAVVVGLHQDLATAQASASKAAAEVIALQTKLTELEAQCVVQTTAGKMAQEPLRTARWRWTVNGFLGGCLITTGVIGAFVIYFLSP